MTRLTYSIAMSIAMSIGLAPSLCPTLAADTIRRTDGTVIENVHVVSEGLLEVVYKDGKGDQRLASDQVLAIEFEKKPKTLEDVEAFLLQEDLESAADTLDAYAQAQVEKPDRQHRWAPAHAAWLAVDVRSRANDVEGVRVAAARLIQSYPDSRYLPLAYLAKAEAERLAGNGTAARETLADFAGLVSSRSLPKRWELECRLAQALSDGQLKPDSRRNELERIASESKDLPLVSWKAQVAIGEDYLAEASTDQGGARGLRGKARGVFEKVIAGERVDRESLAAAHVGLGESLFLLGADADDKDLLREAALELLRVATLYRDQGRFVPKALFLAMRCFDLLQDAQRKADMRRELASLYPSSSWAAEAKKY